MGKRFNLLDKYHVIERVLEGRKAGCTLRQAATAAGVHVATVCRWQNRDPGLSLALRAAAEEASAAWLK